MNMEHRRLTPDFTFICFWWRHELRQLRYMRVPPLVCLCSFSEVFLSSRVTGACPVTTDLIMRINVKTTTTTTVTTAHTVPDMIPVCCTRHPSPTTKNHNHTYDSIPSCCVRDRASSSHKCDDSSTTTTIETTTGTPQQQHSSRTAAAQQQHSSSTAAAQQQTSSETAAKAVV